MSQNATQSAPRGATKQTEAASVATATKPVAKGSCVHHWIIESPNGRESTGTCKRCGATKPFANSTEQVMWEQTNTLRNDLNRATRSSKSEEYSLADEA